MKYCLSLVLLLIPSLIALGLLAVAFCTNWWTISFEKNLPRDNSFIISNDTRISSTLISIVVSRGLLAECIAYRKVNVLVSNLFDFREDSAQKLHNDTCSNPQFTCETGVAILRPVTHCIDQRQKCNQIIDCEDKSDEIGCSLTDCPAGYIKCLDGKTCYRKDEQTCDGVSNCMDNSDEENCDEQKCSMNKHVYCLREKRCARRENSYRCDGIIDCADNSDEENCPQCTGDKHTFSCDSKCFPGKFRCDDIVHCSDFSDELKCDDYSSTKISSESIYHLDRSCEEKRLNPFHIYPPKFEISALESYLNPQQRIQYLNLIYYMRLVVFYGIAGGLILIIFSIVSLFFYACCRQKYRNMPFYFYGIWTLLAWVFITIALASFINSWISRRAILLDDERNSSLETMIHKLNPSLQNLEFFGLSFWLACGAALVTFIGLILSCCICCTIGSARSENKEYEIMHMQNY